MGFERRNTGTITLASIAGLLLVLAFPSAPPAAAGVSGPAFSKVFVPDVIGPGSVSMLRFDIVNNEPVAVTDLAFTDVLPAGVVIATPANASTDCVDGVVSAPDGGGTIGFSDGRVGALESCIITVDVTSSAPGTHMNVSGFLTSSAGAGDTASDDLTVATDRPGFSKSFAPSTVPLGDRSTLTFTIDNSANALDLTFLAFADNFPTGIEIADPANASTTCGTFDFALTATPGTSVVSLLAFGAASPGFEVVVAGGTCTITVDVTATATGSLDNVTGELTFRNGNNLTILSAGKASATLDVTVTPIALTKEFTDDPTPPGSAVELDFGIFNFDRFDSATGISFTDNLAAALPGLTFAGLLSNDCGGSVSGIATTGITFTGGTLAPEGSCTIRVSLSVPGAATPGTYTNTTGAIMADIGGSMVTGNMASDDLFVEPVPLLTKTFVGDPVNPGDSIVLDFTVTNTSSTSSATDIAFQDIFDSVLPTASVTPGNGCCGVGSICTFTPLINPPPPSSVVPASLAISGGSLAPAGMAGDSCSFSITLDVSGGAAPGVYPNTTSEITATVDGATRTGEPASDTFTVIAAPQLTKAFTDDPVAPGGTVTLEFTLTYPPDATGDATGISFTDDLTFLTGLVATGLPPTEACDPDGPGGSPGTGTLTGTTSLTFMGGTLAPGESCVINVTLDVPAGAAPGSHTNTTSGVGATVEGLAATSAPATDDLEVQGLIFAKEFLGDPVIPGDTVTLRFTIENVHPTDDATGIQFTDDLAAVLPGTPPDLSATLPPSVDTCGGTPGGSSNFLQYTGGSVLNGLTCTIEYTITVPALAADGIYTNTSSFLSTSLGTIDPAVDTLTIDSDLLQLTKEFTDDPVAAGDSVTLEFSLTNLDAGQAASAIGFTDDLDAALTGLTFDSILFDDCGGTVSGTGTTMITVSGVSLAAGGSCTISTSLSVPGGAAASIYTNTTSDVTGTIGNFAVSGDAASDDLTVIQLLDFSKSFDGPTTIGGTAVLTFTITNPGVDTAFGLSFSDDLDAVITGLVATNLPLADVCGSGSLVSGTSFLTFTGGELPPMGGMCSFDVNVLVPATATAGTFPNTTSDLFESGLTVSDPATADLTVVPPPTFAKAFAPDAVGLGFTSTLTFTVDNTASSLAASALDFTDNLPAGLLVATPPNASTTCTGGTLTAVAGTGVVGYTGGSVGAAASCTAQVDVVTGSTGFLSNTTGDLTSSSGNSGSASDVLTVDPPPGFGKSFGPSTIVTGGTATLTFTIDNTASTAGAIGLDFTDNLPAAVTVASPSNAGTDCTGGTLTAASGTGVVTYTGGTASAGAACTVTVDVTSSTPGSHVNTTGALTSSLGSSGTATDTLNVSELAFSKVFTPDTIGPGSTSLLRFDIVNTSAVALAQNLAFTDVLPAGVIIATPSSADTTCTDGILSAPDGGTTIDLSGARLGALGSCTVTVNVTAAAPGVYDNLSGDLTSTLGNSGPASATLTVDAGLPGFSKSFAPSTIPPGGTSTLTFTIDYTAFGGQTALELIAFGAEFLVFDDILPAGVVVASPANATTNCFGGPELPVVTAGPGTGFIGLADGFVFAGSTCTVEVDVTAPAVGLYENVSLELFSGDDPPVSSGFATAVLDVPAAFLIKSFTDDPVPPGGTVTLEFTINNPSRDFPATDIGFMDTIDPLGALAGLAPGEALPKAVCGGVLDVAGGILSFAGGMLPAGGTCNFSVALDVPLTAGAGSFTNTTTAIAATIDGAGVAGNTATDDLVISAAPILTKEFIDDPVGAGSPVTLRFTIINTSPDSDLFGIAFQDVFDTVLPTASVTPGNGCCGVGSICTFTPLSVDPLPPFDVTPANLSISGGSLAPAGMTGDSCTFDVTLDVSMGVATGTYPNTTSEIDGLLADCPFGPASNPPGGEVCATPVTGLPASDDLQVIGAPDFSKAFIDDPVAPGASVTLEFTLSYPAEAPAPATGIAFMDDLVGSTGLAGLAATGLPLNDVCGAGSAISGTSTLTFTGGTLAPGESCSFSVTVDVPVGAAAGIYLNETSNIVATVSGMTVVGGQANDDLVVAGLTLIKQFTDDPVIAGGLVTLEFVISNDGPDDFVDISFSDDLDAVLPGLVATGLPLANACDPDPMDAIPGTGTLSTPDGGMTIEFAGGSLLSGEFCAFSVTLQVPLGTMSGTYPNQTSDFSATIVEDVFFFPNAMDDLVVANEQLFLTKEFVDDPTVPGGTVTLEFSFSTLGVAESASDLAFTDDLDAALAGLVVVGPLATGTCGGTLTGAGTGFLDYSGGGLTGGECSFSVTLQVPAAVPFGTTITNTTSSVTGTIGALPVTGSPASDDLMIDFFTFTKFFDGLTKPTGTPILTFTIENLSTMDAIDNLAFTDDLDLVISGLVATGLPAEPCGLGSTISGTSLLALSGGNLLPGGSCTFSVDLLVPADAPGGTFLNTTSNLQVLGVAAASPATALLTVDPGPTFNKIFLPDFILPGQRSALSFLIDNSGSAFAATDLAFFDDLPAGLVVAFGADVGTTCPGGTVTAAEGGSAITFSGGALAAGGSCVVQVDVTGAVPGTYVNTSSQLTSSSGLGPAAIATLVIVGSGGPCLAPDGEFLTVQDQTIVSTQEFVVCNTFTGGPNLTVIGPDGHLIVRAGVAAEFGEGFFIGVDGQLTVSIEPILLP